jgi:hypothetical protein
MTTVLQDLWKLRVQLVQILEQDGVRSKGDLLGEIPLIDKRGGSRGKQEESGVTCVEGQKEGVGRESTALRKCWPDQWGPSEVPCQAGVVQLSSPHHAQPLTWHGYNSGPESTTAGGDVCSSSSVS